MASSRLRTWGTRVPAWLRPYRAQAALGRSRQDACALALIVLVAGALALDLSLPARGTANGVAVLVVVAAGWLLRGSLLVPVLAVGVLSELVSAATGELDGPATAVGAVTLLVVAATARLGLAGWSHMRDARQHEVSTLLLASHAMGASLDLARVASEAVRAAAGTVMRPGLGGIRPAALLRVAAGRASLLGACDATGVEPAAPHPLGPAGAQLLQVLDHGRPAVVTADQLPAGLGELAGRGRAGAWALARVTVAGEPFGLLAVASPDVQEFRREDLRLLDGIARVAGLAIATAVRHAELDRVKGRLQESVDLALEAGRSLAPTEVVASTLVRVAAGLDADRATLAHLAGGRLVVESTHWRAGAGDPVPVDREFSAAAVEAVPELAGALAAGAPLAVGPLHAEPDGRELAATLADGSHTLVAPFTSRGMTFVLVLSRHGDRPFLPADLAHLRPMADVAVLALRNAHLYARAERAEQEAGTYSRRMRLAIEAAEAVGSSPELTEVLDGVLRRAVEEAHAARGAISRAEGGGLMVVECEHAGAGPAVGIGTEWRLSDSAVAEQAVRTGRPVLGGSAAGVPGPLHRWADLAGVEHVIACPIVLGRELVGLLGLARAHEPFDEEAVLTLQPFTTLAALLLRNARLLAEARQASRAKSAFLNLAAHELRTPLTVIRGYLSMLEDGTYPVPERTREEAVDTLVAKAQELEALVEALLMTARLDVGRLPTVRVRLDVRDAVQAAVDRLAPRARLEGARLRTLLPADEVPVLADRSHVARILDNLLNNALTYSETPARVIVAVRCRSCVEIVVRDRGLGIPPEQHDRVFERFHRLDGQASRFSPGLGLGLSTSRELAHFNDGTLCLERSAPGRGSTFVLHLPPARDPR